MKKLKFWSGFGHFWAFFWFHSGCCEAFELFSCNWIDERREDKEEGKREQEITKEKEKIVKKALHFPIAFKKEEALVRNTPCKDKVKR